MLPAYIMVSEKGSFAEHTILRRKPQIIATVIGKNRYSPDTVKHLYSFAAEIAHGVVVPLADWSACPEWWQTTWSTWQGCTWFELPWFFAEAYFYLRLLEAVGYDQPGPNYHHDPFAPQKEAALAQGLASLESLPARVWNGMEAADAFWLWLRRSLWGNRADLSNITVDTDDHHFGGGDDSARVLIDDTAAITAHLRAAETTRLDLVADNTGPELLSDLVLCSYLLEVGWVSQVRVHLKPMPFFVSDAMLKDAQRAIDVLEGSTNPDVAALGRRLDAQRGSGHLRLEAHAFWASPLHFSELPADLVSLLADSDLVLFKGDANYRRLLDDRHWPFSADMAAIATAIPTSFAALRTIKSELMVNLPEGAAAGLAAEDPDWLVNGKRGVIQAVWR